MTTPDAFTIASADSTRLQLHRWGSNGPDVLLVHGQGEYGLRYAGVAASLAQAGYRFTTLDLRGHGQSGGPRCHVRSWHDYHEDVHAAVRQLTTPYVLIGHSMGGLVVLDYLREHLVPEPIGVVLSNPLVGLAFEPDPVKVLVARVLTSVFPELSLPTGLDTSKLSRDPEVVRQYNADPAIIHKVSVRWYTEMVGALKRVQNGAHYRIPLLMLLGTGDAITSPAASRKLLESWGGPTAHHFYEGLYHEIFNEPEKEQIYADLRAWLDARFAAVPTP